LTRASAPLTRNDRRAEPGTPSAQQPSRPDTAVTPKSTGVPYIHGVNLWSYLDSTYALHALLLTVFLGGMTTGQRGFGKPIEAFYWPRRWSQLTMIAHLFAALAVVGTLGSLMPQYPAAFYIAVGQMAVGFLLFHAVNLKPKNPGILVAFHQAVVLSITISIVAVGH